MDMHYVTVQGDVYCSWVHEPPNYRVYVGDELFTERTFIWRNSFLRETLRLHVPNGKYPIRFEVIGENAEIDVKNLRVVEGQAFIKSGWLLKVGSTGKK